MKKSKIFKKCIFLFCLAIIILGVVLVMLRYEVEGEKNLPYNLKKILVVSTVDGTANDDMENIWNIDLKQSNDLFFYIEKSEDTDKTIKEVRLENFNVSAGSAVGNVVIYRPTGDLDNLYTQSEQNYLNDSLKYSGARIDELKTLEIANTGGVIGCRISLENLGKYISSEETEITYDGRLLTSAGINIENIKTTITFDLVIKTNDDIAYVGNIKIELPSENLLSNGTDNFEITDFSDIVFKRT